MKKHDVIIIGGGPAGSTLAAYLAKKSFDVAIIERETYPRFHIGESLLPASMPIFKETGFYETLSSGKYIRKYGARFVDYRLEDEIYFGFNDGLNPDIPMAFEVQRADFDQDILQHAKACGTTLYQPERVKDVSLNDDGATLVTNKEQYQCSYVIDATGRDALLGKKFGVRAKNDDLNNVAVFSHFTGVKRYSGINEGDILIGLLPERAWSWVIPFLGERTSVGVVCNSKVFNAGTDLSEYLMNSLNASSHLKEYMAHAERVAEVTVISNYSHRCSTYYGDRWMLIGDAAIFLDPIFSSGVHVGVTSAKLAAHTLSEAFERKLSLKDSGLGERYQNELNRGAFRFHKLISMFYNDNFVQAMKKTLTLTHMRQAFTSAVAGDMWNDSNFLFERKVL